MREAGKRWIPTAAAHHPWMGFVSDVKDHDPTVDIAKVSPIGSLRHDDRIVEAESIDRRTGDPLKFSIITNSLAGEPPAAHLGRVAGIAHINTHIELVVYRVGRSEIGRASRKMSKLSIDTPDKVDAGRGRTAGVKKGEQPRSFRLRDIVDS